MASKREASSSDARSNLTTNQFQIWSLKLHLPFFKPCLS